MMKADYISIKLGRYHKYFNFTFMNSYINLREDQLTGTKF